MRCCKYLDYKNCKCKKTLVDMKCTENVEQVNIAEIASIELHSSGHENVFVCSYAVCFILAVTALAISIGIGAYIAYSRCYLKKDVTHIKFGTSTQCNCARTTI